MKVIIFVLLALSIFTSFAQKPSINLETVEKWPSLYGDITSDGKYGFYIQDNGILTVKAISDTWAISFPHAANPILTSDNKYLVYELGTDSLVFFELGKRAVQFIERGRQFKELKSSSSNCYSWFSSTGKITDLIIWQSNTNKKIKVHSIKALYSGRKGDRMLLVLDGIDCYTLNWFNLLSGKITSIINIPNLPSQVIFDDSGDQAAILLADSNNTLYVVNKSGQAEIINTKLSQIGKGYVVSEEKINFTAPGDHLIFSIKKDKNDNLHSTRNPDYSSVDIWHYRDEILQSQQLNELKDVPRNSFACYNLNQKALTLLTKDKNDRYSGYEKYQGIKYFLIKREIRDPAEIQIWPGSDEVKKSVIIIDKKNHKQRIIADSGYYFNAQFSYNQKYIVYYDQIKKKYYSYETNTGITRDISSIIPVPIYNLDWDSESPPLSRPIGIAGWLDGEQNILIYDEFDIWQIDLQGKKKPVNITGGYGRKHQIQLRIWTYSNKDNGSVFKTNQCILIRGLDQNNYNVGFCEVEINKSIDLGNIKLEPHSYSAIYKKGNFYVVNRASNKQPYNLYFSSDLRSYFPISNVQPQETWNWCTKELVEFPLFDGSYSKGILYKPENFDPKLIYPVIFTFYDKASSTIHQFETPKLCTGYIQPLWFASRGYVVFQPDINFKFGQPGESAFNSVLSAAKYLSRLSWVDSTRMGLSGASHGGFSVNYITTRTKMFTAAAASCGIVDMISGYGALRGNGFSRQSLYETFQERIGATLWDKPNLYIENSAVFKANKVFTPILIMHNKNDDAVPWGQGLEWYMALRRLGKKAWMLQYDEESHGVFSQKNKMDYTIRLEQFFDYYLKDAPPPKWMTQGIPAKMKGIDSGFELDKSGKQP